MVVAPSGVGKTSLTRRLVADHNDLHLSISATTRDPRPGEHDGRDYHFVTTDKFQAMIDQDAFLEWAEVYGNFYGSPKPPIMAALDRGESVLFDIDFQGAMKVHAQAGAGQRAGLHPAAVAGRDEPPPARAQPGQRGGHPPPPVARQGRGRRLGAVRLRHSE
jgi:guanylate kinase